MPDRLIQRDRLARLTTPLGEDILVFHKMVGTEAISDHFEWRVTCLLNAGETPVEPKDLIGKPCGVELVADDSRTRHFHGICTELRFRGWHYDYMSYELTLRPWTWLLTRQTHSRIFHDVSVKDIIQQVFSKAGFSEVDVLLQGDYQPIHYTVQYQETDYAFVSRLMEKYGIFFYFKSLPDGYKLVLVDRQTTLPDIPGYGALRFQPYTETGIRGDRLFRWHAESRLRTAIVDVDDYNYDRPNTALEKTGNAKDDPGHGHNKLRKYRYPAGHAEPGVGQLLADVFVDAERADAERKYAWGWAPMIHAGGAFTLADHPVAEENVKHFAVSARHSVFVQHFRTGATTGSGDDREEEPEDDHYVGEYEVALSQKAYKAPLKTPWPRIWGAQTALVIKSRDAPNDEEIDVDDQGRILVLFHWRDVGDSGQASCRVRVAQIWAGSQWGGVWIPRVGMEAVVEFLEGDPDRPLVTGTVYNGNNKPPITFPGDKTRSTIKTNSSKGGAGFNELRFEDKKDDEEIYIHAERDRLMEIEHDDDITIGNNQTVKIGGSRTFELTGGDETVTLKGAPMTKDKYGSTITKGGHRTTTLEMGDETLTVKEGKRTTTIKMDDKRTVNQGNDVVIIGQGNQTNTVKVGNQTNTVETGNQTNRIEKGNQKVMILMGNQTTQIDMGNQSTDIKMGNQTTKLALGKSTNEAMQSWEIKVGSSSIKIDQMGVTIKGMMIKIDGTMMTDVKGLMTTVKGTAMLTVKGGIVMIN